MSQVEPFKLPFVTFKQKQNLPSISGIYYILNRFNNDIIYIGQSKNIRSRWTEHHRSYEIGMIDYMYQDGRIIIAWEECSQNLLLEIEKQRIKALKPIINGLSQEDASEALRQEDKWEDLPEYYRYLMKYEKYLIKKDIDSYAIEYLKQKPYLLETINYRHFVKKRIIPRYRYLEQFCLFYYPARIESIPVCKKYTSDIYHLVNDEIRLVISFVLSSIHSTYKIHTNYISKNNALYGIGLLLGHLIDADIRATSEIIPTGNYHTTFRKLLDSKDLQKTLISLLRPFFQKVALKNWVYIQEITLMDLEEGFFGYEVDKCI